jgi:sulfate transport system ATP-binding protein
MTVELHQVRRKFRGVAALDGVSLSVRAGEFLALLGPSGSGKTTLLRVLAGLDFADAGRIVINGRDMMGVPARKRRIGFVFQHYALFRHMSVASNIAFGLSVRPRSTRPPQATMRARVEDLLQMMGIPELADRLPHEISGGQRQRVALARALAIEPELLLLDEPFGALDAKVRHNLRLWLRELHDRMGLTSIFVTHDQAEAMQMADRVAVMRSGQLEQVDVPDRLYAEPASAFVHDFLGESVRFSCTVEAGLAHFDSLPLPPLPTTCEPGPAVALIRPHEVRLTHDAGPGLVELVQASGGPLAQIRVRVGRLLIDAVQPAESALPRAGEGCGLDLSRARVFPANGGPAGRVSTPGAPRLFGALSATR